MQPARAEPPPVVADLAAQLKLAREQNVPLFVAFTLKRCPYCNRARREYWKPMHESADWRAKTRIVEVVLDDTPALIDFAGNAVTTREFAKALLKRVGLEAKLNHLPRQLSTGQQQRVAVARALANRPQLVLADEPTGNLDHANAREALTLIREACRENRAALLLVSHDREVLAQFESVQELAKLNRAAK